MGQIILDHYLTRRGLTEESCRMALNLSEDDLAGHTLRIKLVKKPKKKKTRAFLVHQAIFG